MQAPPLADVPRYPAIGGTCLIALGIYALAAPGTIEPLTMDIRAVWLEPWRLLTSALLHAGQLQSERWMDGLFHVGFNSYWLWTLGAPVEQRIGHLRTLGLIVLLAVGSSLLEYAFLGPSVGLSGVVYGFAAMLWVLGRRSPSWRGLIDKRTAQFFVFWFGFCVIATITDVLPIANFAHAGGALLGAMVGWAMLARERKRVGWIAAIVATVALFGVAATPSLGRRYINFSEAPGQDAMILAMRAMDDGDIDQAIVWAERGVGYWRSSADDWARLSWLYFNAERYTDARDAIAQASQRAPENEGYRTALTQLEILSKRP